MPHKQAVISNNKPSLGTALGPNANFLLAFRRKQNKDKGKKSSSVVVLLSRKAKCLPQVPESESEKVPQIFWAITKKKA